MKPMNSKDVAQFVAWQGRDSLRRQHVRRQHRSYLALALICGIAAGAIAAGFWLK